MLVVRGDAGRRPESSTLNEEDGNEGSAFQAGMWVAWMQRCRVAHAASALAGFGGVRPSARKRSTPRSLRMGLAVMKRSLSNR